jgi:hypothetical protein
MISREEARQTIEDWTNVEGMTMDRIDAVCLIEKIYESIGSCGECESMNWKEGTMLAECVLYGCLKQPNGYCDEFNRKEK